MADPPRSSTIRVLLVLLSIVGLAQSDGLAISYCSPDNNAGSYPAYYAQYQSTGLCGDHCLGSYAFAVLQGNNCWCSNYVPADQENTYNCNQDCPGTALEWCGNTDAGLFAYFQLSGGQALGTAGSNSASSSPVSTTPNRSGSSSIPPSIVHTSPRSSSTSLVTLVPPQQSSAQASSSTLVTPGPAGDPSSIVSALSSAAAAQSTTFSSLSSPSPTASPSPSNVYTSVTTVTGQVRTVVITPSASADATLGQASTAGGTGVSAGKVAGIVVGVAIGLGLLIGAGVWWWLRRRHREEGSMSPVGSFSPQRTDGSSNTIPSRQVSQMSQAGLLGRRPRLQTTGIAPGNDPRSADTMSSNVDRRSIGTDQRLNPYALYSHDERNISNVSLQDNQDYSRQLRIANPDP